MSFVSVSMSQILSSIKSNLIFEIFYFERQWRVGYQSLYTSESAMELILYESYTMSYDNIEADVQKAGPQERSSRVWMGQNLFRPLHLG